MGLLSDFLTSPLGEVGYGAMSELYDQANVRAGEQQKMFLGLGDDLRAERRVNSALFNEKLSNFRAMELDFINNAPKWDPNATDKSPEELKALFAPMGSYLAKGDTFVGKPNDVRTKVMQLFRMSGGFKIGDPYVTEQEFIDKTKIANAAPIKKWSGLGHHTFQNQVESLTFKQPEFESLGTVDSTLRLTAANLPMFYQQFAGLDTNAQAVTDLARLSILNYNARQDATVGTDFNLAKYQQLKDERYNWIQTNSPQPIKESAILEMLDISDEQLQSLLKLDTTYTAAITGIVNNINRKIQSDPNYAGSSEFQNEKGRMTELIIANLNETSNITDAIRTKEWAKVPKGDVEAAERIYYRKLQETFPSADDVRSIYDKHRKVLQNPELVDEPIIKFDAEGNVLPAGQTSGALAVYINEGGGKISVGAAPGMVADEDQIPGRIAETFQFITVPQEEVDAPAVWVAVSDTGVIFELPGVNALSYIEEERYFPPEAERKDLATVTNFDPNTNEGLNALREHAKKIIGYAMNNQIKLTFYDENYVKRLEDAGIFGLDNISKQPITYFGQTEWVKKITTYKQKLR